MNRKTLPVYIIAHFFVYMYYYTLENAYESLQSGLDNQKWGLKRFDGAPTLTAL